MNEHLPTRVSFFKRMNQKRSHVVAFVIAILSILTFTTIVITQRCDVGVSAVQAPEVIVGKAVTLKQLKEEYFIDYHKMFSPEVRKNLEFPAQITLTYTINYLRQELRRSAVGDMLMYVIFDNKDGKLIGSTEIRELNDQDPGQVGIWLNENYWGGGRAAEALALITEAYFKLHPEHDSYIAHVRLWNTRSFKLLTKFGFKDEGFFYEHGEPARHILRYTRKK